MRSARNAWLERRRRVTAYPLHAEHRAQVLATATAAIARGLTGAGLTLPAAPAAGDDPALAQPAATFVTLTQGDAPLGCAGSLVAREPLATAVARHAWQAAFADPRLPTVTPAGFTTMAVSVSVLSPLSPIQARSWRDVRRHVGPGDGVVVRSGSRQATLLPAAWSSLPDPAEFLDVLWHKAGLRPRGWLPGTCALRYSTEECVDAGPRAAAR